MIKTLQLYVARELLKTFALTAIGLTLTFSLCGGVLNMIQAEVLTSLQMLRVLLFVLPVALTLTLPVSAIFSCAMVYGRLAADNEIDACKASGVNIYRLLMPAFALSVATAAFTFSFTNYMLPRFVEGLDAMVRKDLEKVLVQALKTRGYIRRGGYVIYARNAEFAGAEGDTKKIDIDRAAFLELEGERLTRCGTARKVEVDFQTPPDANPTVQASMLNVRGFDLKRNQFYEEELQPFHSVEIPATLKQKLKWLTLPQLLHYADRIVQLPALQEQIRNVRNQIRDARFYAEVIERLTTGDRVLRFKDARIEYEIRAERARQDKTDSRPILDNVVIREWRSAAVAGGQNARDRRAEREYTAEGARLKLKRGFAGVPDTVGLFLPGTVSVRDSREPGRKIPGRDMTLDEVVVSAEFAAQNTGLSDEEILAIPAGRLDVRRVATADPEPLGLSGRIEDARVGIRKEAARQYLDLVSIVHSRLAFSASVLVMLVLAAALGIIFRGGQLLTAFVISFAPALLVVVMNIAGRQLASNLATQWMGIGIIWGGIVLVALADVVVLTRYLKR